MNTSQIDTAILSAVGDRWTKVAMVIAVSADAMHPGLQPDDQECEAIARRIETLVRNGQLEAQGSTQFWRSSEVRFKRERDISQP
jgi:hypothetical protein